MVAHLIRSLFTVACTLAAMLAIVSILATEHVERSVALTISILIVGYAATLWNKAHRPHAAPDRSARPR